MLPNTEAQRKGWASTRMPTAVQQRSTMCLAGMGSLPLSLCGSPRRGARPHTPAQRQSCHPQGKECHRDDRPRPPGPEKHPRAVTSVTTNRTAGVCLGGGTRMQTQLSAVLCLEEDEGSRPENPVLCHVKPSGRLLGSALGNC